jgi:hypothetical protein
MHNSKNIIITKDILAPSKGQHTIIPNLFTWRTEKKFTGRNQIAIVNPQEASWWNRPLKSDVLLKQESDGLYSYNLPLWHRDNEKLSFKADYNILINKYSVPYAVNIQTDDAWTEAQKQLLPDMLYTCVLDTLLAFGVNKDDLTNIGNDLYFQGRKFSCSEQLFEDGVFTQGAIVTLKVLPEKDDFARLTGKYAHRKTITGIAEEVPSITKEAFIDKLYETVCAYVEEHFN